MVSQRLPVPWMTSDFWCSKWNNLIGSSSEWWFWSLIQNHLTNKCFLLCLTWVCRPLYDLVEVPGELLVGQVGPDVDDDVVGQVVHQLPLALHHLDHEDDGDDGSIIKKDQMVKNITITKFIVKETSQTSSLILIVIRQKISFKREKKAHRLCCGPRHQAGSHHLLKNILSWPSSLLTSESSLYHLLLQIQIHKYHHSHYQNQI